MCNNGVMNNFDNLMTKYFLSYPKPPQSVSHCWECLKYNHPPLIRKNMYQLSFKIKYKYKIKYKHDYRYTGLQWCSIFLLYNVTIVTRIPLKTVHRGLNHSLKQNERRRIRSKTNNGGWLDHVITNTVTYHKYKWKYKIHKNLKQKEGGRMRSETNNGGRLDYVITYSCSVIPYLRRGKTRNGPAAPLETCKTRLEWDQTWF